MIWEIWLVDRLPHQCLDASPRTGAELFELSLWHRLQGPEKKLMLKIRYLARCIRVGQQECYRTPFEPAAHVSRIHARRPCLDACTKPFSETKKKVHARSQPFIPRLPLEKTNKSHLLISYSVPSAATIRSIRFKSISSERFKTARIRS